MHRNPHDYRGPVRLESEFYVRTILESFANYSYVLHRKHFGREYFSVAAVISLFLPVMFFVLIAGGMPFTFLPLLSVAFFVALIYHRSDLLRRPAGMRIHSRYNGLPRMCIRYDYSERVAKKWLEPLSMALIGLFFCLLDPATGLFLMMSAFAAFLDHSITEGYWNARLRRMIDAEIETEVLFDELDQRSLR